MNEHEQDKVDAEKWRKHEKVILTALSLLEAARPLVTTLEMLKDAKADIK